MSKPIKDFSALNNLLDFDDIEETTFTPEREQKYNIVSIIAYLCGMWVGFFGDGQNFDIDVYDRLELNKNARVVRNLCMIRARMERGYKNLFDGFKEGRSVLSMSEYVPADALAQLAKDGVRLSQKPNTSPIEYITQLNGEIQNRINNCKSIVPEWINWEYVKEIFIMPKGTTEAGAKAAAAEYYENMACYPYKTYINIPVPHEDGNILRNDKKFVTTLYHNNLDEFSDLNKVIDVSSQIKVDIYDFLNKGEKVVMIVDCENSNVYNIINMLRSLEWEHVQRVSKIILVNDVHQNIGWQELGKYTDLPIEHIMTQRVMDNKSLVDGTLIAKAFTELYEENVDAFVLLSSDSDFWTLIDAMHSKAKFLVMVEHMKCGPDYKDILANAGVFFCYLDDFNAGEESEQMKNDILLRTLTNEININSFNLKQTLDKALEDLRIDMNAAHKEQFYKNHLKPLQIVIDEDGTVRFECKYK